MKPHDLAGQGKTALITGASSGIGAELCRLLARDGFDLVLVARDKERLLKLAAELKSQHRTHATVIAKDLSRGESAAEIYRELLDQGISVDILINNAGFNVYGRFAETDKLRELALLQLGVITPTELMKLFIPPMLERGYGRILNIGSTGSFVPGPLNSVYCASKAYLLSVSEAVHMELKGSGVTVTTVCPGAAASEFASRAGMKDTRVFRRRTMSCRAVARAAYRALRKQKRVAVPGLSNRLAVFATRLVPRRLTLWFAHFLMRRRP
ncbi:MAG: SDR family oxidoreductase [Candidatus Aminicenantes bacterium]|nr:SDR family oxidoreductase [Candidatus Aminicenantes bacterium]